MVQRKPPGTFRDLVNTLYILSDSEESACAQEAIAKNLLLIRNAIRRNQSNSFNPSTTIKENQEGLKPV